MKPSLAPLAAALATAALSPAVHAEAESLDRITVTTAAGFVQNLEDAPASITVVDRAQLERRPYVDITDALKDIPGVLITDSSDGGSFQDISLRGMSSRYTMILVDGRRVNSRDIDTNGGDAGLEQAFLPPIQAIERIEVIRGPMSSLYGSEAMGGVINIITRKVAPNWTGSLQADTTLQDAGHGGDNRQGSVFLTGPLTENLGLRVHGMTRNREADRWDGGYVEQRIRAGGAALAWQLDPSNDLTLGVDTSDHERDGEKFSKQVYNLAHAGTWGRLVTDSYVQYEDSENSTRSSPVIGQGIEMDTLLVNSKATYAWGRNMTTFGVQYKDEKLRDNATNLLATLGFTEITRWETAAFLENEFSVTDRFAVTAGVRFIYDEMFHDAVTPRLYGVYHATDTLTLKGGVSTGYRQPSIRQATDDYGQVTGGGDWERQGLPHPRAMILGSSDLDPERSISYELGFSYAPWSTLDLTVMAFQTDFKDKITELRRCEDPNADRNDYSTWTCTHAGEKWLFLSENINVDEAQSRGVEASLAWQLLPSISWSTAYTYTESEQKSGEFKGRPLNRLPRHLLSAALDWQATDQVAPWVRVQYRSRTSDYLSRTSMSDGTEGYTFVDVGVNYRASEHLTLKGGVSNLADRIVYNSDGDQILDGRRYELGMILSF